MLHINGLVNQPAYSKTARKMESISLYIQCKNNNIKKIQRNYILTA